MASMLGLFMMPIVQDQNILLTYAIACTFVQARNFNLLLLLLSVFYVFKQLFVLALPITLYSHYSDSLCKIFSNISHYLT